MSGPNTGVTVPPPIARGWGTEKQTFTPLELAAVCRVGRRQPRAWAVRGWIPCVVTGGGHRRYWRPALDFLPKSGDPQLLSVQDVGRLWSMSDVAVIRMIRSRQIHGVRLPGARLLRVWRSDIDLMLPERMVSGRE